ncbi:hypothetical protein LXL04_011586 [Taraxacum kok-saghyz]
MTQTAREKDSSSRPVYARFAEAKWYKCCRQDDTTPPAMCDRGKMASRKQPPQRSSITFKKTPPAMWDRVKIVNRKRPPPQSTISAAGIYV